MSGPPAQTAATPRLRIETVATREAARFLSEMIQTFLREGLGFPPEGADAVQVRLAVTEALTNVARHAYPAREPGPLVLEMHREGGWLVVSVRDRGVPFDPTGRAGVHIPSSAELAEGGYGLGIIREVMDEWEHRHSDGRGNLLLLKKRLWP